MIKVLVNGAKGRMGQETVRAIQADPDLELVAQTGVGDNFSRILKETGAQVAIDFTSVESGYHNTKIIIEAGVRPVIGTSGFTEKQVRELQTFAAEKKLGGVIAPNFAIGAVLMMKFSAEAAKYMPQVEILEVHHEKKADSPSGTGLRTAEMIANSRASKPIAIAEKAIIPGARGADLEGVKLHSMRLPGVVAQQTVFFGGVGQTLKIEHNSLNRESFMPGVCIACKKVVSLNKLYYGLEHLL
jgi:4-hydroxy-tetrahydrodipicolinate reductase